jgi:cytochrome b
MMKEIKVWDPVVRIGHWVLVIAFFTAYFTEEDFLTAHVWAGYTVTAIVLFRVLWGFIGTEHAKFKDFIYSPVAVFGYLGGLLRGKPQHYLGHNPAGGAMVIALLIGLAGTAFTGLKLHAIENNAGPLAINTPQSANTYHIIPIAKAETEKEENEENEQAEKAASSETSENAAIAATSESEKENGKEGDEFWEEWHENFVNFTLLLVFLHIAGVIFSSIVDKENFVKAMITGRKQIRQNQD